MLRDLFERIHVLLWNWFLDEHRAHTFQFVTDFDGESRCHLAVEVKGEFDIGAYPLAHEIGAFHKRINNRGRFMRSPFAAGPALKRLVAALFLQEL